MNEEKKGWNPRVFAIGLSFFLVILLGIGLMIYPMVASKYTESVRSEIHTTYEEAVNEVDTSEIDRLREAAHAYNQGLFTGEFSRLAFKENGYYDQLKLNDTDVMCYISIPKINVSLPVYHGVGPDTLEKGAGHIEQSSLPVGGSNTHAVISAHSGMASSPMFSDLELLQTGDTFHIQVLGETMTYQVCNIEVVLPQEVDAIQIQKGRDIVSLVTCTPYGINTHRLIVSGQRIENLTEDVSETIPVLAEDEEPTSVWVDQYWNSVKIGAIIAVGIILSMYTVSFVLKKRKTGDNHETE